MNTRHKINIFLLYVIIVLVSLQVQARPAFNRSKDLLLAQYDLKPDEDDVQSAVALACMLRHEDMVDVNYYAVAGTYGRQEATFITPTVPDFFTRLFGPQNVRWTDAHHDRNGSVLRVRDRIKAVLDADGKVFIAEGGQSHFTYDVAHALLADGVAATTMASRVIVVQHSYRNEAKDMSTPERLRWVKDNTHYIHIDDGNRSDNDTPGYRTYDKRYMKEAMAADNPNRVARRFWSQAHAICTDFESSWENKHIAAGGVDFSDHVEVWWILNQAETANTLDCFWERYVTNRDGFVERSGLSIVTSPLSGYRYGDDYIVFEAEVTQSPLGQWILRKPGDPEYRKGKSSLGPISNTYLEFTGNNPNNGKPHSPLVYRFVAPKTGSYQLLARMMQNLKGLPNDKCNDVYIRMAGDFTSGGSFKTEDLQRNLKFYGRGLDTWGNMYKGELDTGWQQPMIYNLKEGEAYVFTVFGRAQRTCVDYFIIYDTAIDFKGIGEPKNGRNTDIAVVNDPRFLPEQDTPASDGRK